MCLTLGLLSGQLVGAWISGTAGAFVMSIPAVLCIFRGRSPTVILGLSLLAAAVGYIQVDRILRPRFEPHHVVRLAGSTVRVRARVIARPKQGALRTRLLLEITSAQRDGQWETSTGRVRVTLWKSTQPWHRGDQLEAPLRLWRPHNFGNPGEFDYTAHLARQRVYVTGFARSDTSWQRTPTGGGISIAFDSWRDRVSAIIDEKLDGVERQIMKALLIGNVELDPDIRERYGRAGVSHVLAISGLHVGLVAGSAFGLWRWLLSRSQRLLLCANVPKLSVALTTIPVLLYAGLAGGSTPTLRAVTMGLLVGGAVLVDRRHHWLAQLAGAALAISLMWPGALFEISFQLSFTAVLALVLGMRRVKEWWDSWEEAHLIRLRGPGWRWLRHTVMYLAVTLCATAGTLPLTALHFNLISCIGPLANPIVVPILGFLPVSLGLLAALCTPFSSTAAGSLFTAAGAFIHWADRLVMWFATLPGAALRVPTPSLLELLLIYTILGTILLGSRLRRVLLVGCAIFLLLDVAYWYAWRYHQPKLRITFLSVGHGDCTIVQFPGSEILVVDGGGLSSTFDVGERVVAPYLWRQKIGQVSHIALTHPDFDHYGGLTFLARAFVPKEFWWNGSRGNGKRFKTFWQTLQAENIPVTRIHRGFRREFGGVDVLALAPDGRREGSVNDRSLVLRLRYGPTTVLLTGDLQERGERQLVDRLRPLLRSQILKVPHHGSATSSSARFIDAVEPEMAIVSVAHDRRFGLPHASVQDAYRSRGIRLLRTDRDGAVVLEIGATGSIKVHRGRG